MPQVDGDELPVYSTRCMRCVHLTSVIDRQCEAYPERIPDPIWRDEDPHTTSRPGDHGITFTPRREVVQDR